MRLLQFDQVLFQFLLVFANSATQVMKIEVSNLTKHLEIRDHLSDVSVAILSQIDAEFAKCSIILAKAAICPTKVQNV